MASLGIKYRAIQTASYTLQPELNFSYVDSKVNNFAETNANALQALNLYSQGSHSFVSELAVSSRFAVNAKLSLSGRVGVSRNFVDAKRDVTANVVGETTPFTVRAPGMGGTTFSLGAGANYSATDKLNLGASLRVTSAKDAKTAVAINLMANLSF